MKYLALAVRAEVFSSRLPFQHTEYRVDRDLKAPNPARQEKPLHLLDSSQGLSSNQIHQLARDRQGRLWLASPVGLTRYDGSFVLSWDRASGLTCNGLRCVTIDDENSVWIGTDLGFELLDSNGQPQLSVAPDMWRFGLCQRIVAAKGVAWLGCAHGLVRLERISPTDGYRLAAHFDTGYIVSLICIGENRVIAASSRDGLIESDGMQSWSYRCEALLGRQVTHVLEGFDGEILVGTDSGLFVIDDVSKRQLARLNLPGADTETTITALAIERDKYWGAFGNTLACFSRTDPDGAACEQFYADSTINDLLVDSLGNVFLATNSSGLACLSCLRSAIQRIDLRHEGGVYLVTHRKAEEYLVGGDGILGQLDLGPQSASFSPLQAGLPNTVVWDCLALDDCTFAATQAGLFSAPRGGVFTRAFATDPVLDAPNRVLVHRGDAIWTGTLRGLTCIRNGIAQQVEAGGLSLGYVYAMCLDQQQALWICTLGRGLWREQNGLVAIVGPLLTATGNTYAIAQGPGGGFVVLQDENVVLLDTNLDARLVTALPPVSGWSLTWIDEHTIAIGASDGLRIVDITSGQVISKVCALLPMRDWEFTNNRTLVQDGAGRFLCGVAGGLLRVDYAHLKSYLPPTCQLVDVQWTGIAPKYKNGEALLRPGKWSFRLRACAPWFIDLAGLRYQFRLVGFDVDWSAPIARGEVTFNSLPPGRYSLVCRAQSPLAGIGPETEMLRLVVQVPFWAMGWSTMLAGIETLYNQQIHARSRNTALLEQNRALEVAVAERTGALVRSNHELEALRDAYEKLSEFDELTGLGNRRKFESEIKRMIALAMRLQIPLALLILDIDHFKAVNDRLGHPVGDEYLRVIGGVLAAAVRNGEDIATRYGGEEFAVLLVKTGVDGATSFAERIRAGVEALKLRNDLAAAGIVTVSIGIAVALIGSTSQRDDLVGIADRALYQAKNGGRNRVVVGQ